MNGLKRNALRVSALVTLVVLAVLPAAAQDEGPALNMPLVEYGEPHQAELASERDAHLLAFNGAAGDTITITMIPTDADSTLDPYLALLGSAGQVYAANDDADVMAGEFFSLIENYTLPESGTYFLLAATFATMNSSFNTLDVEVVDDTEAGATLEPGSLSYEIVIERHSSGGEVPADLVYSALALNAGEPVQVSISQEAPIQYVTFEGAASEVITLGAESDEIDTLIYIFDAVGQRVAANNDRDRDNVNFDAEVSDFELPADGVYLAFVTASDYFDVPGYPDLIGENTITITLETE
jgi:hypothetical protein